MKREMNKFDKWISITYAERCDFDVTTNHASAMKIRFISLDSLMGR